MSVPKAHLQFQQAELSKLDEQLEMMRRWGVLESDPGFQALQAARGVATGKIGRMLPRLVTWVKSLFGFSPGEIKLWADAEIGWKIETRAKPGAPPIYKYVPDEVAEKIVKEELTHEEFQQLLMPDPYIGE